MPKTIEGLQGAGKVPNKAISVKTRDATPKPGMIPTLTRPCLACTRSSTTLLIVDAPKVPARRGRPPGSTKKKKEAALAAQAALAAAGGLRAPGRVNPELEPTDDEIEAELNTMLGAPAAAAALADVKQEA